MDSRRFQLLVELGRGAMGVVHEAYDRLRGMRVARKQITQLDAASLYRFKREFRALRGLSHPNIIQLYELLQLDDDWFITMEVIEGQDFISHVRRGVQVHSGRTGTGSNSMLPTQTAVITDGATAREKRVVAPVPAVSPDSLQSWSESVHEPQLRSALTQLANALVVLHHAGIVHRDLKPSNIMVTADGQVVLMDFGVVAELARSESIFDRPMAGTPVYMAPEQFAQSRPTPAADWYAFGVVLYQALTGHAPFVGAIRDIAAAKSAVDPIPPSALVSGVPPDLEALCLRLLNRTASERPTDAELLRIFGRLPATAESLARIGCRTLFVGRTELLAALNEAFDAVSRGAGAGVLVEGAAGMGKSALLARFERELSEDRAPSSPPYWLAGSCHGHERIPYNAFDGVVDQLCAVLLDLEDTHRRVLLEDGGRVLARLFPILRQLPELQTEAPLEEGDLVGLRRQGFSAMRALVGALTRERPVVICIDDVHLADAESVQLLRALTEEPMLPGVLLLVSAASDALESGALATLVTHGGFRRMVLPPLSGAARSAFVERLSLPDAGHAGRRLVSAMWREAAGHPMLLGEIARHIVRERSMDGLEEAERQGVPKLQFLIRRRAERLDPQSYGLLRAVALAGRRIPLRAAARACDLDDHERERYSADLANRQFVRITWTSAHPSAHPWIAAEHAKIRESILGSIADSERRALYRRLAEALEETDEALSALTAECWQGAGEPDRAARHILRAAEDAARQLAFGRTVQLYRSLIDMVPRERAEPDELRALYQAHIGLARSMRITDRSDEALVELEHAGTIAEALDALEERATVHYLRGNICFHTGDLERCLAEHRSAQALADRADSSTLRCNALSGLGDAQFIRGYFTSALRHYDECIELAWKHDLTSILAANLPARGMMHYFTSQLGNALRDSSGGAELSVRIGHKRAELVARSGSLSLVLLEQARYEQALHELRRALELGQLLGSRRFEPVVLAMMGKAAVLMGERDRGMAWIHQGVDVCREIGFDFVGPLVLGVLMRFTDERDTREWAMSRGQEILDGGTISHSYLLFYRDAMEASLHSGGPGDVERYACALEAYSAREPTPWSEFFVARARALDAHVRQGRTPSVQRRLRALHEHALEIGFAEAAVALGVALG